MEISIKNESQRFLQFLEEANNSNIIFSGIYGIGKSYFINDFFNNQHSKEYIPIILTPVNYSVASNEDIFEYIKSDILLQLLEKVPCDFNNIQITSSVATYFYIENNLDILIGNILSTAEKVCFKTDIIHQLLKLRENIKKFQKEKSLSENAEVKSFMTKISQKLGSIYESNIITQIIQNLISNAKGEKGKEAILIIDDLDRIDPEHIFRILNILSVHDDFCRTNEHKFKFDKTILVCDIENIRKIFHAKYGADVDFSGYIDKFYSKEIFHFDNVNEIAKCIANQVMNITNNSTISSRGNFAYFNIVFLLRHLLIYNLINIRTIEKFNFDYKEYNECILFNQKRFWINSSPSLVVFEFLKRISGSSDSLKSKLLRLSKNKGIYNDGEMNYILESFIILADLPNNKLENNKFSYKEINYTIETNNSRFIANIDHQASDETKVNLFELVYEAYLNYQTYFCV